MLRVLMLVSGAFEALFGLSALVAPGALVAAIGTAADPTSIFLARILGAATLGLGIAALIARDALDSQGGLAVAYGLAFYNILAGALILWSAWIAGLGGGALLGAGLFHAVMAVLFVLALIRREA